MCKSAEGLMYLCTKVHILENAKKMKGWDTFDAHYH